MKNRLYSILLISLISATLFSSCEEDELISYDYTQQQLVAKQLVGTWGQSFDIETPIGVPGTVFQNLTLVFSIDEKGNPHKFYSEGCDDVLGSTVNSTWEWSDAHTLTNVLLKDVEPIAKITVDVSVKDQLTISFVSDWHDTEGNAGSNEMFSVTLKRQK